MNLCSAQPAFGKLQSSEGLAGTIFKQILDGHADVMVTDASETLLQQKLNPGLCSVHPDKPFQFGEKAYLLPRGDVVFQQYVDQWLHLSRSTGEFQSITDKWLK